MSVLNNSNAIESGGGYSIQRSLRFRSSAGAYLSRTPAVASNRKTWTWSGWVKRGALADGVLITASNGTQYVYFAFSTNSLTLQINTGTNYIYTTTAVLRDPSAWYHIVLAVDTTQTLDANRVQIYVNGVAQARTAGGVPQNTDTQLNVSAVPSWIGSNGGVNTFFDGYLTEVNFIDGQALTPSSFGEFSTETGVWVPKKYTGTYGTNGFYLDFKTNTSATTLAYDKSGNSNNWTPNNISTTAGATYDSMTDVPTMWADGGNGRGNYAVWNPLSSNFYNTATDGNLRMDVPNVRSCLSNIAMSSGKWYCEISMGAVPAIVGIADATYSYLQSGGNSVFDAARTYGYISNGNKRSAAVDTAYGDSWVAGNIIGIAYDADAGSLTFYKNGATQGVAYTGITVPVVFAAYGGLGTGAGTFAYLNCGQRPFVYTPPTGFKALNTFNLPDPTIKKPNQYMDATTYTGNGSTLAVTNSGGFQPDLVWVKQRSVARDNQLTDSVRGVNKELQSNTTGAETNYGLVSAFNSNGFSVYTNGTYLASNENGGFYVGWQWKKGATPGFDIVTFTGNGGSQTIAHNLGVAPSMMICKSRNNAQNWIVYHKSVGATKALFLDTTDAETTSINFWANVTPSSTGFAVGPTFANGYTYVNYLFAEIPGFSKFGSYTGNGSADGPFVYCGFRPKYVMVKRTDSTGNWEIQDTSRSPYNQIGDYLLANASDAEVGGSVLAIDSLSNGFKVRTSQANQNASGGTYIFAAFAEKPFKYSNAR